MESTTTVSDRHEHLSDSQKREIKRRLIEAMDEIPVWDYETWQALDRYYWFLCGKPDFHPSGSKHV